MNERRTRLEDQFEAAEAAVDASKALVRKASAERLNALLQRPAGERLQGLNDSFLTPFDQEQLERSLEAQLPKQRAPRIDAPAARSLWAKRFMRRHRRGLIATAITVVPMALLCMKAVLRVKRHQEPTRWRHEEPIHPRYSEAPA